MSSEPVETEGTAPTSPVEYLEPGRGYRSLVYFGLLLAAGFTFDLVLGGGIDHLPGWIVSAVIVLGLDLLVIYAARTTKTLTVDAHEIRIGDEVIGRDDVQGADAGVDPELPVLGWTTGLPRGVKGVTVQLDADRRAVIPTRHPDRLLAALGVAVAAAPSERALEIRAAGPDDLPQLPEIDERADTLFRISGFDLPEVEFDDGFDAAAAVFVAGTPPVGFVRLDVVDGLAHLTGIAVLPGSMRRGIGGLLMDQACAWAASAGYPAITLTTYADVPWNGPVYARHGWVEVASPTPGLARIRAQEAEHGLDAVGRRVVLRREL